MEEVGVGLLVKADRVIALSVTFFSGREAAVESSVIYDKPQDWEYCEERISDGITSPTIDDAGIQRSTQSQNDGRFLLKIIGAIHKSKPANRGPENTTEKADV
jgi:hypothetical protein